MSCVRRSTAIARMGLWFSSLKHTVKIFCFIFLISLVLNSVIGLIGEEALAGLFSGLPVVGELIAALVGLIPNCAVVRCNHTVVPGWNYPAGRYDGRTFGECRCGISGAVPAEPRL